MKKVLLIARAKTPETLQKADVFAGRIQAELGDTVEIESCEITELFFELSEDSIAVYHPKKQLDLRDFDLIVMRHVGKRWVEAHMIAQYCRHLGIPFTDTYLDRLLPDSKLSNAFVLWCHGVRQWPHTFAGPVDELARRMPELGEKVVLKDSDGSKGRLNFVISSPKELASIAHTHPDVQFLMQEFIPNDSDLRVLVMDGRIVLAIRRSGDGSSHLNNTSQGGAAELIDPTELDAEIRAASVTAAQRLELQVAGVDVMRDTRDGTYYLLEVNNAPQISSGSFTEEKASAYAAMLQGLLAKEDDA